jgi:4-hydroxybutyryl-CoA dehydratase/vinylacetyl-CoA-Delta-isomerase
MNQPTESGKEKKPFMIRTGAEYIESLRGRKLKVYLFGELIEDPVEHPMIRPSVNALAATYDLAQSEPELATGLSLITGERINRFLHVAQSRNDVVMQSKMQRRLGQLTGTCFQRCVGMDAINSLHSVTYEIDQLKGTRFHRRFLDFVGFAQKRGLVIGGAMTDVKGDRSKAPHQQQDKDLYVHVTQRTEDGVYIRGAKAHQTGCINSHWLIVMPTIRLGENDSDFAIVGAIPADADGITYVYGRQSCDSRSMEDADIDAGNALYSGQEAMIIFDDVFIPNEHIFMDGQYEFAASLVERFTCYHRRSYVCTSGVGDVLIGAAAAIADFNGVEKASHIRDKLVEMTFLNETIYSTGVASSFQSVKLQSGVYQCDDMIANICKHHVTKIPYDMGRLAQDLAGGLVVTLPSQKDLEHEDIGPLLEKYLVGRKGVATQDRIRVLRLIENMTLGRNAVGYLTESLHGAGSPQAQRVQISRQSQLKHKKRLALKLAGVDLDKSDMEDDADGYLGRVFDPENKK